jgi:hypothetical protein
MSYGYAASSWHDIAEPVFIWEESLTHCYCSTNTRVHYENRKVLAKFLNITKLDLENLILH